MRSGQQKVKAFGYYLLYRYMHICMCVCVCVLYEEPRNILKWYAEIN